MTVAAEPAISMATVKARVGALLGNGAARDRVGLVILAHRSCLVR